MTSITETMNDDILICPVCGGVLSRSGGSLLCEKRHCFDISAKGYVNLLLPNHMNAKLPGDNKLMVGARRRFLEKGYYEPLADALCVCAGEYFPDEGAFLDAGCGEGYYTEKMLSALYGRKKKVRAAAVDISKAACAAAAVRLKSCPVSVMTAAASVFRLPAACCGTDMLTTIFAPLCMEEFTRVLKTGGILIMVIPAPRHLWQLKQAVYDEPYENTPHDYALEGYELIDRRSVEDTIELRCREDISDLFMMTPYYYKTGEEGHRRLEALETLTTEIAFEVLVYRKNPQ